MAHIKISCSIWGTDAIELRKGPHGDYLDIDSPRAAGKYRITNNATGTVQSLDRQGHARLTTWLVDQRKFGNDLPTVDKSVVDRAHTARPLSILERRDRLMRYLARRVRHLGDWVGIAGQVTVEKRQNAMEILAWIESTAEKDIYFFLSHLEKSGHVEFDGNLRNGVRLTPEGYAYIEKLDATNVESSQVFVAMWFDPSLKEAYEKGFAQAITDAGYHSIRIDRVEHINKIDDEIIAAIRRSRFLVADFTSEPEKPRGGVYFEAGFAYGLKIPVIWTCRHDLIDHLHFDTRQFNHIAWSDPEDLYRQLKNRIEAVIGDGPLKGTV